MPARDKVYSMVDVAKHNTPKSLWIAYRGKIYDFTEFASDHPGGDSLILKFAGGDMGEAMADPTEHVHSRAAYEMMDEFLIGQLGGSEKIVSEDWVPDPNFHPEDTDTLADFQRSKFIDLQKPLLAQVWKGGFSKEFYLEQVHQPRHVKVSARLFGSDLLEPLTRTKWWVVPMIWLPITAFLGVLSLAQFNDSSIGYRDLLTHLTSPLSNSFSSTTSATPKNLPALSTPTALAGFTSSFALGCIVWTILEYTLHRFLFHLDYYLPDNGVAITLHFLLHGIHHYLPMDKLRLVMPPTLFFILETPFTQLAHVIFPKAMANGVITGAFAFYVLYDMVHYFSHHMRVSEGYLADMKKYHLAHHYQNFDLGYGVTSKFWDYVFGTVLPMEVK